MEFSEQTLVLRCCSTGEQIELDRQKAVFLNRDPDGTLKFSKAPAAEQLQAGIDFRNGSFCLIYWGDSDNACLNGVQLPLGKPCPLKTEDVISLAGVRFVVEEKREKREYPYYEGIPLPVYAPPEYFRSKKK